MVHETLAIAAMSSIANLSLVFGIVVGVTACSTSDPASDGSPATGGSGGQTGGTASGGASGDGGATGLGGAAGTGGAKQYCGDGSVQSSDLTIDIADQQQKISGFGVSTAWGSNFKDPVNDPDTLWSTTKGAGLTLHRIRIGYGNTTETTIAKKAVEYGVKVWATPWEVKRDFTDRDNCPGNSACSPAPKLVDPQGWADTLATFAKTMKAAGVPIYAISAENEPDSGGMNGTTSFTANELATWIGSYLGPALEASGTGTKVMGPETMNWWGFGGYFTAIENNADAWKYTQVIASHQYGVGAEKPEPSIAAAGKEYWETEVDTGTTADDPTADNMPSALHLAQQIHDDLTGMNLNAFHYWWLYAGGSSGLYDTNTNVWTKRFWVMGNFSRFARPGYVRVGTSGNTPDGVAVSAYLDKTSDTLAIVAINHNDSEVSLPIFISNNVPCSLTPYETSSEQSLGEGTSIAVSKSRVTLTLAAHSVTTFVGP